MKQIKTHFIQTLSIIIKCRIQLDSNFHCFRSHVELKSTRYFIYDAIFLSSCSLFSALLNQNFTNFMNNLF